MAQKIYVIRHGETDWNKDKRFQGQSDIPLNEAGRAQAAGLVVRLKDILPFDCVVTSDLSRAKETAEIMCADYPTLIRIDEGFREMSFGPWEGLDTPTIQSRWPGVIDNWFSSGQLDIPDGETLEHLQERVWSSFLRWAQNPEYQTIAIICHGGSGGALACAAMGEPPQEMSRYMRKMGNTGMYLLTAAGQGKYNLEYLDK